VLLIPGTTIPTDITKPAKMRYKVLVAREDTNKFKLKYFSIIIKIIPNRNDKKIGIIFFISMNLG